MSPCDHENQASQPHASTCEPQNSTGHGSSQTGDAPSLLQSLLKSSLPPFFGSLIASAGFFVKKKFSYKFTQKVLDKEEKTLYDAAKSWGKRHEAQKIEMR